MGLFDDAEKLLADKAAKEREAIAEKKRLQEPWCSDWTMELVEALQEFPINQLPLYSGRSHRGGFDGEFWDYAWVLRCRWDNSHSACEFALKVDGTLWYIRYPKVINMLKERESLTRRNPVAPTYTGIETRHENGFIRIDQPPESVKWAYASKVWGYETIGSLEQLRSIVGVQIAVALRLGNVPNNGVVEGAS